MAKLKKNYSLILIPIGELIAEIMVLIGYIFLFVKFSDWIWKITSLFLIRTFTVVLFFVGLSAIILFAKCVIIKTTVSIADKLDL